MAQRFSRGGPMKDFWNTLLLRKFDSEPSDSLLFVMPNDICLRHGYSEIEIKEMYYDETLELVVAFWLCPMCGMISKEVFK